MKPIYSLIVSFVITVLNPVALFAQDCNFDFSLGNDTTIDCNASITLEAPTGFSYLWSNGSTDQSITVSDPDSYSCTISATEASIVLNGDFQNGETDFSTDYSPGSGGPYGLLSTEGEYAITSNSADVHNNFASCFDHTFGDNTGSMLVVNGASFPDFRVWYQTVSVVPNTDYQFSIWGMSCTINSPAELSFVVDGNPVGDVFNLEPITCQWDNHTAVWNSGTNTSVEIAIINQSLLSSGNDFAIDDISFSPVCEYTDEIVVNNPAATEITAPEDATICEGESITLTASSSVAGTTFLWQPGDISGASITVSPTQTTQYTISGTLPSGCESLPAEVMVNVVSGADFDLGPDWTICQGESAVLSVDLPGAEVEWSNGQTGNEIHVSEAGVYTATITVNNCSATDEVAVSVLPPPTVSISGSDTLCDGENGTLQASPGNYTYEWSTGETGNPININAGGVYSVLVTDQETGCTGEASHQVLRMSAPNISLSDSIHLCNGNSKTVLAFTENGTEIVWDDGTEGKSYDITEPGVYTATATNSCGSTVRSVNVVGEDCTSTLFVPNSFTPNGDGLNDIFKAVGRNISTFKMTIFDRWGNQVFTSSDLNFGWNGSFEGDGYFVPAGIYAWIAILEYPDGDRVTKKGYVELIR